MQRPRRHARTVEKFDHFKGDERRLLGRFCDNAVSGRNRSSDLSDEYCQRKIPGTYANEYASAARAQFVAFACRSRQQPRRKRASRFCGVVATIVGSLADLRNTIVDRLAGLVLQ